MSIKGRGEIILFFVLVLLSLVAVMYYFYKAAYRFDPFYKYETTKDMNESVDSDLN